MTNSQKYDNFSLTNLKITYIMRELKFLGLWMTLAICVLLMAIFLEHNVLGIAFIAMIIVLFGKLFSMLFRDARYQRQRDEEVKNMYK